MTKKDQALTVDIPVEKETPTAANIVKDDAIAAEKAKKKAATAQTKTVKANNKLADTPDDSIKIIFDAVNNLNHANDFTDKTANNITASDNTSNSKDADKSNNAADQNNTVEIATNSDSLITDLNNVTKKIALGNTPDLIIELVDTVTKMTRLQTIPANETKFSENLQALLKPILDAGYLTMDKLPVKPTGDRIKINLTHQTRNVTRTKVVEQIIEYTMIDQTKAPDKVKRRLKFVQNGIKDLVTKQIEWDDTPQTQSFSAVSSPECSGYEPDIAVVPKQTITITNDNFTHSLDRNILVNYIREVLHITIDIIDDDENGRCLQSIPLTGYNDQYFPLTSDKLAASFKKNHLLISQSNLPEKIVFKTGQSPKYQIHLVHELENLSTNDPNLRAESNYTIYFKDKYGNELQKPYVITQQFKRDGQRDLVNHNLKYSDWKPIGNVARYATLPKALKDQQGQELIPLNTQIAIPTLKANVNSQIEEIYLVPKQYVTLIFIELGKEVHRMTLKFDVFEDRYLRLDQISDDLQKQGIKVIRGQNVPQKFSYNQEKDDKRLYKIEVQDIYEDKQIHIPVKRIIEVTMPNETVRRIVQNSPLERTETTNMRTHKKTYGPWSRNIWDEYRPPRITGFVPTQKKIEQVILNHDISKTKPIKISYLPYHDPDQNTNNVNDLAQPKTAPKKSLFSRLKSYFIGDEHQKDDTLALQAPKEESDK